MEGHKRKYDSKYKAKVALEAIQELTKSFSKKQTLNFQHRSRWSIHERSIHPNSQRSEIPNQHGW